MKSLTKVLAMTLVLLLGSTFLVNEGVNAQKNYRNFNEIELNSRPHSIETSYTLVVPETGYLPARLWYTKGDYKGYVYKESYVITKDKKNVGTYRGTLYLYVVPNKLDPVEE